MRAGLLVLLCGCRQLLGFDEVQEQPVDAADPDADKGVCAGSATGLLPQVCFTNVPPAVTFASSTFYTDSDAACTPVAMHPELCFVAGSAISIDGRTDVRGTRPLVLWSASTITMSPSSVLDLSSDVLVRGAGSDDSTCPVVDGSADMSTLPRLGSGGCGGSFAGVGGNGGDGSDGARLVITTCVGSRQLLDHVRGGCRGGHGGLSNAVGTLNGGASGGAVYLMAKDMIAIHGVIAANGSGGRVANANASSLAAGGGGGSGGLIGFDAPLIQLDGATVVAVGGGGSSGSGMDLTTVFQGNSGKQPASNPPAFALGSPATVANNSGGSGSIDGNAGGNVAANNSGGGGGGAGGVGYIAAFGTLELTDSMILPPNQ